MLQNLRALELRAGAGLTLPAPLPRLTDLSLMTSEANVALLQQLCAAPWPSLTALELYLDASEQLTADDVLPHLNLKRFPALKHLVVRGVLDSSALVERLSSAGLTSLRVSHGDHDGGFGQSPFPEPGGIEILSEQRFYPVRSGRFVKY